MTHSTLSPSVIKLMPLGRTPPHHEETVADFEKDHLPEDCYEFDHATVQKARRDEVLSRAYAEGAKLNSTTTAE